MYAATPRPIRPTVSSPAGSGNARFEFEIGTALKPRKAKAITAENASTVIPSSFDLQAIAKYYDTDPESLLEVLAAHVIDPKVREKPC
jgi:hypothetical protein